MCRGVRTRASAASGEMAGGDGDKYLAFSYVGRLCHTIRVRGGLLLQNEDS